VDTKFWFAAPDVTRHHSDQPIRIVVTALDFPAVVTISQPANPAFLPITLNVPAFQSVAHDLTNLKSMIESVRSDMVVDTGLLIESDNLVTAYYMSDGGSNPDIFSLKGTNALGNEFVITSAKNMIVSPDYLGSDKIDLNNSNYGPGLNAAYVVASEDLTSITITPSIETAKRIDDADGVFVRWDKRPVGESYTITLNKGQVYSITAAIETGSRTNKEIGGTIVTSNKPVAITFSGDSEAILLNSARDLHGDQLVPVCLATTEYLTLPGKLTANVSGLPNNSVTDILFVYPVQDGTSITVNGTAISEIKNKGEFFQINIQNEGSHIIADKPVLVYQLAGFGKGNNNEIGGAVIPGSKEAGVRFSTARRSRSDPFFILISTKKSLIDWFEFEGISGDVSPQWLELGVEDVYAVLDLSSTGLVPEGATVSVKNSKGLFNLGWINGRDGVGARYGFFSNFSFSLDQTEVWIAAPGEQAVFSYTDPTGTPSGNFQVSDDNGQTWIDILSNSPGYNIGTEGSKIMLSITGDKSIGGLMVKYIRNTGGCAVISAISTIKIGPRPLTVFPGNLSKVYDGQVLSFSLDNLSINGDLFTGHTIQFIEDATIPSITNVGVINNSEISNIFQIIDADGNDVSTMYNLSILDGQLEVTTAPLTIRAEDKSKVYGGPNPELTFSFSGLVNGETGISTLPEIETNVTEAYNVGVYPIILTGGADPNYSITLVSGELTVTKAILNITAENISKIYGEGDPEFFGFSASGFVNSDDVNLLTGSLSRMPGESTGTYTINIGNLSAGVNYTFEFISANLIITAKGLSVIGLTGDDKVYDGNTIATASGTASLDGVIGSDEVSLGGTPVFTFASANVDSEIPITTTGYTIEGADAGNYTLIQPTLSADITAKTLSITQDLTEDKEYDGTTRAFITDVELVGVVDGDDVIVSAVATYEDDFVGTDKTITVVYMLSGDDAGNYVTPIDFVSNAGVITVKELTVTADAGQSKVYGANEPSFSYVATGFANGDTESILSGALARETGEDVGTYAINQGDLSAGDNYTIFLVGFDFSITPLAVTVTADSKSKVYGEVDPALTFVSVPAVGSTLANGEKITFTGVLSRVAGENVGTYAINQHTVDNSNYTITYTGTDLEITPLAVTVTADSKSKIYGEVDPALTFVSVPAVGTTLANGEVITFTGALSRVTGENVGRYAIN